MGAQSMHGLTGNRAHDLDIVGLNGAPQIECGRALAVARRRSDGMHCVLGSGGEAATPSWYDEDEAAAFVAAGRWTRLCNPLPLPVSCVDASDGRIAREPMMVFASNSFLEAAGRNPWPATANGETLVWTCLERYDDSYRAASSSAQSVETLLDDWAKSLKECYDAIYREAGNRTSLKRVADFMLCAARSRSMRWQAYLRYAMAQDSERVRLVFDAFTKNEYPDVPWQSYLDAIRNLSDVLNTVPALPSRSVSSSTAVSTRGKLAGIARRSPLNVLPAMPSAA